VKGTVTSESDIRIDGKLIGDLQCATKMIIGPTGTIEGDVQCENALIEGAFSGTLKVRSTLHIKENAKIEGDIKTDKSKTKPCFEIFRYSWPNDWCRSYWFFWRKMVRQLL